jgi:transcription antitermination factor NusG
VTEGRRSHANLENKVNWYAVYTKPRWEKKVANLLEENGIEYYCPLNKVVKQWSDRKKVVMEPIFKSYVFIKTHCDKKWELKQINGVLNFVYWLGKPAVSKDEEINIIRKFLNEFKGVQVDKIETLAVNARVRIKQGIMMDYQGVLTEVSGNKVKVKIMSMGIQLSAQFEKKNIELIRDFQVQLD